MLIDQTLAPHIVAAQRGLSYHLADNTVTFKATGAETGDAYALFELCTPPDARMPLHRQRFEDEAFFVIEGSYDFVIDGQTRTLRAGDYAFVPRGVAHAYANSGNGAARLLMLTSPGGIHERFLAEAGELIADADLAPLPPNLERLATIGAKYGVEIL
jgi:quercetin dioxygenase-like cupin family protein